MAIQVHCANPNCGERFLRNEKYANTKTRCPMCGDVVQVPALAPTPRTKPLVTQFTSPKSSAVRFSPMHIALGVAGVALTVLVGLLFVIQQNSADRELRIALQAKDLEAAKAESTQLRAENKTLTSALLRTEKQLAKIDRRHRTDLAERKALAEELNELRATLATRTHEYATQQIAWQKEVAELKAGLTGSMTKFNDLLVSKEQEFQKRESSWADRLEDMETDHADKEKDLKARLRKEADKRRKNQANMKAIREIQNAVSASARRSSRRRSRRSSSYSSYQNYNPYSYYSSPYIYNGNQYYGFYGLGTHASYYSGYGSHYAGSPFLHSGSGYHFLPSQTSGLHLSYSHHK